MTWAPSRAAVSSALPRAGSDGWFASTTRMWQCGHAAEIIEMSRVISRSQPLPRPEDGNGDVRPFWLTTRKHPPADVQAGRPYSLRYTAR